MSRTRKGTIRSKIVIERINDTKSNWVAKLWEESRKSEENPESPAETANLAKKKRC